MKPPHDLDPAFEDIDTVDARFQSALNDAKKAYAEQDEFNKQNPDAKGPTPAQEARCAFLDSILP